MIADIKRNQDLISTGGDTGRKTIHSVQILDASGSMNERFYDPEASKYKSKYDAAKEGLNKEIEALKKADDGVNYSLTIIEFDSGSGRRSVDFRWNDVENGKYGNVVNIMPHAWMVSPDKIGKFTGYGASGGTPLYQTVYEVLKRLKNVMNPGDGAVVTIMTDGEENSSNDKYSNGKIVSNMIEEYKTFGINVTYSGTERDIEKVVRETGVSYMNTLVHDGTSRGISKSYGQRVNSLSAYSKGVASGQSVTTDTFFKDVEDPDKK